MSRNHRKSKSKSNNNRNQHARGSGVGVGSGSGASVVEQLSMLRACVGEGSIFSETDLSTCLREAGYMVDLAAERLLTGQYQPRAKRMKPSSSPLWTSPLSKQQQQQQQKPAPSPSIESTMPTTPEKVSASLSSEQKQEQQQQLQSPEKACAMRDSDNITTNNAAASSAPVVTPKQTPTTTKSSPSLYDSSKSTPPQYKVPTDGSISSSELSSALPRASSSSSSSSRWLLCQRWVSDGVCMQRNASIQYQEQLSLRILENASKIIFCGANIQGQLPKSLCQFLHPLLITKTTTQSSENNSNNDNDESTITASSSNSSSVSMIQMDVSALMEERCMPIGAQVPLCLRIWISNPPAFFALFDDAATKSAQSLASSKLFLKTKVKKQNQKQQSEFILPQAAFQLLQWAQHGEAIPTIEESNDDGKNDGTDSTNDSEEKESEEVEEEEELLLETQHENLVEGVEEPSPEMAQLETKSSLIALQEMDAPKEFKAQLRPYQRQALWWMTKRELQHEQEEWGRQRLELLKDLQTSILHQGNNNGDITNGKATDVSLMPLPSSKQPIVCDDCGPVLVNPEHVSAPPVVPKGENNRNNEIDGVNHNDDNGHAKNTIDASLYHPLWERRYLASPDLQQALSFYVQPLFGIASASPPAPPQPCRGGILADSMGLGKTVMLLALIQENPGTTLIVTPLSLLAQWEEELATKTTLKHHIRYGDKKSLFDFDSVDVVLTTYGSLQGELQSHNKRQRELQDTIPLTGLLGHSWTRVILDEAHFVKNTATVASRACCLLRAEQRWCVSGTIIQNSLDDVFALLKFLRHEPWCDHSFWKAAISKVNDVPEALDRVRQVLMPILLRRTKDSLDGDGKPILSLPPVESKTIMVEFSPAERQFYDALHRKSLDLFEGFIKAGTASKSWVTIFSLLHRLRQTCDHVALTVKSHQDQDEWDPSIFQSQEKPSSAGENISNTIDQRFLEDLMKKFKTMQSGSNQLKREDSGEESYASNIANMLNNAVQNKTSSLDQECAICLEEIDIRKSVVTPCIHLFCQQCLVGVLKSDPEYGLSSSNVSNKDQILRCPNGPCPVCNEDIDSSKILRISETDGVIHTSYLLSSSKIPETVVVQEKDGAARHALETAVQGSSSAKLVAVLDELNNIWKEDPGSKVLVFSQFLGFLDLLGQACKSNKIPTSRLDGKLSLKERMAVLKEFSSPNSEELVDTSKSDGVGSVLLISMKAGGVGLNLVAASTVFIVDPWWNAAVEDQCVDRIHRIGQTAEKVRIRKFCVTNSVEERILELQKRKKNMATQVLRDKGTHGTGGTGSRPTMDDLKILFGS